MFLCRRASRYGEPGGVRPGGAWLQDAVPGRVPRIAAWPDADLLEERARGEAHLRVPAGLPGGLLHLHGASVPAGREPVTGLNMEMCMRHACAKLSMCIYFRVHRRMNECVCVFVCVWECVCTIWRGRKPTAFWVQSIALWHRGVSVGHQTNQRRSVSSSVQSHALRKKT